MTTTDLLHINDLGGWHLEFDTDPALLLATQMFMADDIATPMFMADDIATPRAGWYRVSLADDGNLDIGARMGTPPVLVVEVMVVDARAVRVARIIGLLVFVATFAIALRMTGVWK